MAPLTTVLLENERVNTINMWDHANGFECSRSTRLHLSCNRYFYRHTSALLVSFVSQIKATDLIRLN